jgi:hypothetical protein
MNISKKTHPAVIRPNLINEVAYDVVILLVELSSVSILERTR